MYWFPSPSLHVCFALLGRCCIMSVACVRVTKEGWKATFLRGITVQNHSTSKARAGLLYVDAFFVFRSQDPGEWKTEGIRHQTIHHMRCSCGGSFGPEAFSCPAEMDCNTFLNSFRGSNDLEAFKVTVKQKLAYLSNLGSNLFDLRSKTN